MIFTKRNHYNPCFWSSLWNKNYFLAMQRGVSQATPAREQLVHALNVKSDKIRLTTVERTHFDKNLGVAEITKEAAENFVQRYHPEKFDWFVQRSKSDDYPVYIDFEETLTAIEGMAPYQVLMKVALTERIDSVDIVMEKVELAYFLVIQHMRSHAIMNSMIDWHEEIGFAKFEHFVTLKWSLSDTNLMFRLVYPLVSSAWTFYKSQDHIFPLCDSPVMISPESIMVALSPRLLLEISPFKTASESSPPFYQDINSEKIDEYRRRTIGNTFREIVGQHDILDSWQRSNEFRIRVELMKDVTNYNRMIRTEGEKEMWQLNAYGNRR